MNRFADALAAVAATALAASSADAACWSDAAYKAAQVREFDTMLMVEALRCRNTAANFVQDYNEFVIASRPALLKANAALRGHFAGEVGEKSALDAYDNYMTTVANRYGAGTEGLGCEDLASIVRAAVAANGANDVLQQLAETANMAPSVNGQRCTDAPLAMVTIAARP